ncbi:glycosyltransferase family A protein [Marinomonas sp. TI.3.20]|uniref:glycosyltransferase family 2 protein n=1 Tax=Marinomonas sp. TI.3.20 TaxID=3121296 RepID=UPI00311D54B3
MNKEQPLVSIVIPCYNHAKYVQEAIQSVIDQNYENIEFIIIDDGSKDESVTKIQEMIPACQQRFKRFEFRYRPNKGLCATLNEALEWCEGEFFAPVASDDIYFSYKTSEQVNYLLKNNSCVAVFGGAKVIKENGELIVERPSSLKKYQFEDIILNKYSLFTPSQLIRTKIIRDVGCFDTTVMLEDWYIYLKISELGYSLDSIEGVYVSYRRHLNNTTNNIGLMHKERLKVLKIYSENKYYESALAEFNFTKARELVPETKIGSAKYFLIAFFKKPRIFYRLDTLKLIVKFFIPKKILLAKQIGR